ncbi:MAG: hypothetical protein KAT90_05630, partial [Gammaproteobacteria bacterium]|nr:hypothetical protein [Gammaproteobacteria bacterium]
AYVKENESYLKDTWHPDTRPETIEFEPAIKWTRLRIKNTEKGGANDEQGMVEFIATYKTNGKAFRLHEISQFVRNDGDWVYIDGEMPNKKIKLISLTSLLPFSLLFYFFDCFFAFLAPANLQPQVAS